MALATGAIFIEFILWLRAPPESPRRVRLKCYFHPVARRWREEAWFRRKRKSRQKLENIWRSAETNGRDKALEISGGAANLLRCCGIELINLSENCRSEIKLFSCNFYDMYPFSIEMLCFRLNADRRRGDFVIQEKLRQTLKTIVECSEIEGRTFSKDGENGVFEELSRFVTPKDFEGNRYYLIAISVEWIPRSCRSQYRWFPWNCCFHSVAQR